MHSWRVLLLPYLEEHELYEEYDFSQPWDSEANQRLAGRMPKVFALHGEYTPGRVTTNYLAVVGPDTLWPGASPRQPDDITDDPATTILIVENVGAEVHWMEPRDLDRATLPLEIGRPDGISSTYDPPAVVMLDDSLRKVALDLPAETLDAMLTSAGGEEFDDPGDGYLLDGRMRPRRNDP